MWVFVPGFLPGWYFDVRDGVEVLEEVFSLDVSASEGGPEQPQPQVGEGEEVPQALHTFHAGVQVYHVLLLRPREHGEARHHLELHVLIVLGADPAGVLLGADDPRDVGGREVAHSFGGHVEGVQAVVGVELIGLPGPAVVHGFIQHHDGGTAIFEGDLDVIRELQALVPGHADVRQQGLRVASPGDRLPVGDRSSALVVLHQLRRVGKVGVGRITLIAAQVWVLLQVTKKPKRSARWEFRRKRPQFYKERRVMLINLFCQIIFEYDT